MKIYRPIEKNLISQNFGENKNSSYAKWGMLGHNGIDFSCLTGTPFYWYSLQYGEVLKQEDDYNGGIGLFVLTADNGKYYIHRFWHLKKVVVSAGQKLSSGQLLGYTDNTGHNTTGPHLHGLDIKEVEKNEYGNWQTINYENGYHGSVNPSKFFENVFILDYLKNLTSQISIITRIIELMKELLKGRK